MRVVVEDGVMRDEGDVIGKTVDASEVGVGEVGNVVGTKGEDVLVVVTLQPYISSLMQGS